MEDRALAPRLQISSGRQVEGRINYPVTVLKKIRRKNPRIPEFCLIPKAHRMPVNEEDPVYKTLQV